MERSTNKSPGQVWEDKQKQLDAESREILAEKEKRDLEDRLDALSPDRRALHEELQHDPERCRCFAIEGV